MELFGIIEKNDSSLDLINADLEKMQKQIDFLQKELFSDPLTQAYNRKWFVDYYLENDKFKNDGDIAFIDLDNFKFINDTYGHLVGDQVLKYLVKFLNTNLNYPGVSISRYAGDEFIILFDKEKTINQDNKLLLEQTQAKLAKQKLKSSKIKEFQFSFSYGITSFKSNQNIEEVLEAVDRLMYLNKQKNKK